MTPEKKGIPGYEYAIYAESNPPCNLSERKSFLFPHVDRSRCGAVYRSNLGVNPLHTNDRYVSELPFQQRIVPGLLTASMLTHLGGLWSFCSLIRNL